MYEGNQPAPRPNELSGASTPNVLGQRGSDDGWPALAPTRPSQSSSLIFGVVLAVVGVVIAVGLLVSVEPRDPCAVVDEMLAENVPETTLVRPADWMPSRVLPGYEVKWDRGIGLEAVIRSRVNPEESRIELARDRFVDAHEEEWEGVRWASFTAFRFAEMDGALAYQAFANRFACQFANETFQGPRGSIGLQIRYAGGDIGEQVSWVSGDTRILVSTWFEDPPPDHSVIESLAAVIPSP